VTEDDIVSSIIACRRFALKCLLRAFSINNYICREQCKKQ